MIYTVYSNAYEVLRTALMTNLRALLSSYSGIGLFDAVPLLVPSRGVETDLQRTLALDEGIAAGWSFMTPDRWMGFFTRAPMANVVGDEVDWMVWRELRQRGPESFREAAGHERLKAFLDGKSDEEIYAFSRRVSALFAVYASYRADWIFHWLGVAPALVEGEDEHWKAESKALEASPDFQWQRDLWQRLAQNPHWRGLRFLESFANNLAILSAQPTPKERDAMVTVTLDPGRRVSIPPELHIFLPFVVPPLMLPILKALSLSGRDIWFYLLNPSDAYWFDSNDWRAQGAEQTIHPLLLSDAQNVRANIDRLWQFTREPDTTPLLSARAQMQAAPRPDVHTSVTLNAEVYRAHQRVTIDYERTGAERLSYFVERRAASLLARVQDSLYKNDPALVLNDAGGLGATKDGTLQLWNCPTETRQWEAVAEGIVSLLAEDSTLKPSDILVATPDPTAAMTLVNKAFSSVPPRYRFPWKISAVEMLSLDVGAQALEGLVGLLTGRARRDELLAWLALEPVASRLGLSSDDLTTLSQWLASAGYREGLTPEHLLGLSPEVFRDDQDMCLERALERLTLGYAFPEHEDIPFFDVHPVSGRDPMDWQIPGVNEHSALLETLSTLLRTLEAFRVATLEEATPEVWSQWVQQALVTFFAASMPSDVVRQALAQLVDEQLLAKDSEAPVTMRFTLFMRALLNKLSAPKMATLPSASVMVSNMEALRGLPYRVVIVAGLNANSGFPGVTQREEFDLMSVVPRRGDRDARLNRRNLFLDLLLSARERFIVTYVSSAQPQEADVIQPSVVAQELRDWLLSLVDDPVARAQEAAALTQRIPLSSWTEANFTPEAGLWRGHNPELLRALQTATSVAEQGVLALAPSPLTAPLAPEPTLPAGWTLADPGVLTVTIASLAAFFKDPQRWALRAMGLFVKEPAQVSSETLLGEKNEGLGGWLKDQDLLEAVAQGECDASIEARYLTDPLSGAKAVRSWTYEASLEKIQSALDAFDRATASYSRLAPQTLDVSLFEGKVHLTGVVDDLALATDGVSTCLLRFSLDEKVTVRSVFEWLALTAASSQAAQSVALHWWVTDKKHQLMEVSPSVLSPDEAKTLLESAVIAFLAACQRPALLKRAGLRYGDAQAQWFDHRAQTEELAQSKLLSDVVHWQRKRPESWSELVGIWEKLCNVLTSEDVGGN